MILTMEKEPFLKYGKNYLSEVVAIDADLMIKTNFGQIQLSEKRVTPTEQKDDKG